MIRFRSVTYFIKVYNIVPQYNPKKFVATNTCVYVHRFYTVGTLALLKKVDRHNKSAIKIPYRAFVTCITNLNV